MAERTYYTPGLVFTSQMSAHQEVCRGKTTKRADDGTVINETRELLAEFAFLGGNYSYTNPETGAVEQAPDIRGHYFDLDMQAEAKGWDKHEKETVARHLLRTYEAGRSADFSLWSAPAATKPWGTYDEIPAEKIADIADATGTVVEALRYEKENKKRVTVVKALESLQDFSQVEESLVAV